MFEADFIQPLHKEFSLFSIHSRHILIIGFPQSKAGTCRFLQRCRCSHRQKIMHLFHIFSHICARYQKTQAPACNRECFGKRIASNYPLSATWQRSCCDMLIRRKYDMFIHLICNYKGIILLCQLEDIFQFRSAKHFPAGVRGVADNNGFCPLCKCRFQRCRIKAECRRFQRHIDGIRTAQNRISSIVFIKGAEYNHLITRIANRHHSGHHSLGRATGHNNFCFRINFVAKNRRIFFSDTLAQILRTKSDGILMLFPTRRHCRQRIQQCLRRIKVREALRQVDASRLCIADARHTADHGICKGIHSFTQLRHAITPYSIPANF